MEGGKEIEIAQKEKVLEEKKKKLRWVLFIIC